MYLWEHRSLCIGPSASLLPRVYGAVAMHVGIYHPFTVRINGGKTFTSRCLIVPPGIKHEVDFGGSIDAKLFVELDGPDFQYFSKRFSYAGKLISISHHIEILKCFRWIYEENPSKEQIRFRLNALLNIEGTFKPRIEPRVQEVINLIRSDPARNFTQEDLASSIHISPSRFLHLFKNQLGVPYRQFRMWKRLQDATRKLNSVDNMTRAALDSGFSDSTHFSHSYRKTFGVSPSLVFKNVNRFE